MKEEEKEGHRVVDYDDKIMMPCSQGTLIEQFQGFNSDGYIRGHVDAEMLESATVASFNVLSSGMNVNHNVLSSTHRRTQTHSLTEVMDLGTSLNPTGVRNNFLVTRSVQR